MIFWIMPLFIYKNVINNSFPEYIIKKGVFMLNYLWAFMVLAGTLYGMITGNVDKITDALLTGGGSAIDMAMTLFGVVALWTGLMNIAMKSGLINCIQENYRRL